MPDEDLRAVATTASRPDEAGAAPVSTYFTCMARAAESLDDTEGRQVAAAALEPPVLLIDERRGRLAPPCSQTGAAPAVQAEGVTVGGWIRLQCLERCRHALLRPDAHSGGVAAAARRWGFVNPRHFSRSFRAAYGTAPGERRLDGASGRVSIAVSG